MKFTILVLLLGVSLLLTSCGGSSSGTGGGSGGNSDTGLYAYVPCTDGTILQYDISSTGALTLASSIKVGSASAGSSVPATIPNAIAISFYALNAYVTESASDGSYGKIDEIKLGANGQLEAPFASIVSSTATSFNNIALSPLGQPAQIYASVSTPQEYVEEYAVGANGALTAQTSIPNVEDLVIPSYDAPYGFALTASGIQAYTVNGAVSPVGSAVAPPGAVVGLAATSQSLGGSLYAVFSSGTNGQITVQQYSVSDGQQGMLTPVGTPENTGLTGNHAFLAVTPNGPYAYIASSTSSGAGIIQKYLVNGNEPLTLEGSPVSIPHAPNGLTIYGPVSNGGSTAPSTAGP